MCDSPIKGHGGKHYLKSRIIEAFPPRESYVHYAEAYFLTGAVLLAHDSEDKSEVANDINGDVTNFWLVLKDDAMFAEFSRIIQATPFSEVEFDAAQIRRLTQDVPFSNIQRAVDFFIVVRQSLAGREKDFALISRNRTRRGMNEQASAWWGAVEKLDQVHGRIGRVLVFNMEARDFIRKQDSKKTMHYLDPPYVPKTRASKKVYKFEMSEREHAMLLGTIGNGKMFMSGEEFLSLGGNNTLEEFMVQCSVPLEGKFLLSGYDNDLYRAAEKFYGWNRVEIVIPNSAAGGADKRLMTEVLWANYKIGGDQLGLI